MLWVFPWKIAIVIVLAAVALLFSGVWMKRRDRYASGSASASAPAHYHPHSSEKSE